MRIAINGFGRIGRAVLRQIALDPRHDDIEVVTINDIAPLETLAYLFKYDSTYGPFPGQTDASQSFLTVQGRKIRFTQISEASRLNLVGIDLLLDCTGKANTPRQAAAGLGAGAEKILISGPCEGADVTVVLGANDDILTDQRVVSNASCTTNAIAPILRLIDETHGIFRGHVTTVHCYTNSQPLVDGPRGSLPRSRAAAQSMIPTTTSATSLTAHVLPQLVGRLTGAAIRVPTVSVSCIDAVLTLETPMEDDGLTWLREVVDASPVLGWIDDPVVSTDMRARPESLIVSGSETILNDGFQLRLFGWYDNEWGFSARMIDVARRMIPESSA